MRYRVVASALALLLVVLPSCSDDDAAATVLRVVVPDEIVRAEGDECGGARPFRDIHEGVAYAVVSDDGVTLTEGELPPGTAENADPSMDWGDLERIPTVCIIELEVGELEEHDGYELRIDGAGPLDFGPEDVSVGTPIVLVVNG